MWILIKLAGNLHRDSLCLVTYNCKRVSLSYTHIIEIFIILRTPFVIITFGVKIIIKRKHRGRFRRSKDLGWLYKNRQGILQFSNDDLYVFVCINIRFLFLLDVLLALVRSVGFLNLLCIIFVSIDTRKV